MKNDAIDGPARWTGLTGARLSRRAAVRAGAGVAGVAATFGLAQPRVRAQEATPVPGAAVTVAAQRLTNPRGFAWDASGALYVALAGSGGASILGPDSGGGYASTGSSGIVARIENGIPVTVSDDLPSTTVPGERTLGPAAVAFLGGELYVLEDANAMAYRREGKQPDGVYRVGAADASLTLVADTAAWFAANPTEFKPADYNAEGELFGMVTIGDLLWVVESNQGQVVTVALDGAITRVADLSTNHPLPTGPAPSPNGGVYVGLLTPAPYTDGSAKVVEVLPDGTVTDVWTGLTMVTAVAIAPDGTLYAAEMATGNNDAPPYVAPATGRVVRRTGPDSLEPVATNVNYPVALAFGSDGGLYVAAPALGSLDPDGYILRIDVSAAGPTDVRAAARAAGGRDFGTAGVDHFGGTPPAAEETTPSPPTEAVVPVASPVAGAQIVSLEAGNFYFKPNALTVPAATSVTIEIRNVAEIPHNFSIDALGVNTPIDPGQTASVTVTAPAGSFEFYCNLPGHKAAGMVGTLTAG